MRKSFGAIIAVLAIAASSVAVAAVAGHMSFVASIDGGVLSLATGSLPRGWFNKGNTLDRTKTSLEVTWDLEATNCSDRVSGALSSVTAGSFDAATNPAGNVNGWYWSTTADLSAFANRWNNYVHCDGSVEVQGCAEPMTGAVTVAAMSDAMVCIKDDGVCIAVVEPVSMAAVQDADVIETVCEEAGGCGIGPCVSACQQACNSIQNKAAQQACKKQCPCACKLERPDHCPDAHECLDE